MSLCGFTQVTAQTNGPDNPDCHGTLVVGVSQDCMTFSLNLTPYPNTNIEEYYVEVDGIAYHQWVVQQNWENRSHVHIKAYIKWYGTASWIQETTVNRPPCFPIFPVCIIKAAPTSGFVPLTVLFDGSESYNPNPDGAPLIHYWDIAGLSDGTGESIEYTFLNRGTYTVTQTVKIPNGLSSSCSQVIEVRNHTLWLPLICTTRCEDQSMRIALGDMSASEYPLQPSWSVIPFQLVYNGDGTLPHGMNVTATGPLNKVTVQWAGGYSKNLGWMTQSIIYGIWLGLQNPFDPIESDGRWRLRAPGMYLVTHAVDCNGSWKYVSFWVQWDPEGYEVTTAMAVHLQHNVTIFAPWGEWVTSP